MTTAIAELAAADSYREVERLVQKLVWMAVAGHGLDPDDALSRAHQGWMKAYRRHDPDRGAFTTLVWWAVRNELLKLAGRDGRRRERIFPLASPDVRGREPRLLERIAADLGDDARLVVGLLADTPAELAAIARVRTPAKARRMLRDHLTGLGWSMARVVACFDEIREALTS